MRVTTWPVVLLLALWADEVYSNTDDSSEVAEHALHAATSPSSTNGRRGVDQSYEMKEELDGARQMTDTKSSYEAIGVDTLDIAAGKESGGTDGRPEQKAHQTFS